jgi:predicted TIM-barrel fold metal-dependent hydrolase
MATKILDTDQHVTPPADLWTKRMPAKYQDWAPRLVDLPEGGQGWMFEGGNLVHLFGLENVGGMDPRKIGWRLNYKDCSPDYWDAKARIKALDVDGVGAALVFPSVAGQSYRIENDDLFFECLRVYNEGIWEWAHEGDAKRLVPAALIPNRDVEVAIGELKRAQKKGFRHFQYMGPPSGSPYPTPADDPFWAAAQESGMVVSMHGGGSPVPANRTKGAPIKKQPGLAAPPIRDQESVGVSRGGGLFVCVPLAQLVFTGVFERFPGLKVGLIETSAGWWPWFVEQMDATFARNRWVGGSKLTKRPSEYLKNVKISVDRELYGIRHRDQIGVDKIMFGTDYPHVGTFWPHTRFYVDSVFQDVPDDERDRILWGNAASLYGIN